MFYRVAEGKFKDKPIRVAYVHKGPQTAMLGCHTRAVQRIGHFVLLGIRLDQKQYGEFQDKQIFDPNCNANYKIMGTLPEEFSRLEDAIWLRNFVWEDIIRAFSPIGVVIFSDRVNRGSRASSLTSAFTQTYGTSTGGPPIVIGNSCALFYKWLSKRPDLGTVIASPVLNNPNYTRPGVDGQEYYGYTNYGLCQVWMFFPKGRVFYTPGTPSEEDFLENMLKTYALVDYKVRFKTTYDETP